MTLEEKSIQTVEANELLAEENAQVLDFSLSIINDGENAKEAQDVEAGLVCQDECIENGGKPIETYIAPNKFAKKFVDLFPKGTGQGQQPGSNRLSVFSACTTLACVVLLCLYIVRSQATDLPPSTDVSQQTFYRSSHFSIPWLPSEERPSFTWGSIQQLFDLHTDKTRLHVKVPSLDLDSHLIKEAPQLHDDNVPFDTSERTLKIFGRPSYCTAPDANCGNEVTATYTTHLHLSEMSDCHHFTKLILTKWNFPKIHHIKLHKMLIREQEFHALTKFIEKHNETLHRVEIDECFLCPSPVCDAGLINFPDHDFQITITRRRESPDWL